MRDATTPPATTITVTTADRLGRRTAVVTRGRREVRDLFCLDDAARRERFAREAVTLLDWPETDASLQELRDALWEQAAAADADEAAARRGRLVVRRASDLAPRPIEWLWPGRVAVGKLTLVAGDPGLGKSFVTLDMAARVSRGAAGAFAWPDAGFALGGGGGHADVTDFTAAAGRDAREVAAGGDDGLDAFGGDGDLEDGDDSGGGDSGGARGVLLLTAEDDPADTVAPRLAALGADASRVAVLDAVESPDGEGETRRRAFSLRDDLPPLEQTLDERAAAGEPVRLVVIDPISAYLAGVDTHRNADVRGVLTPLADLAARRRVAVVAVTHLAKGSAASPAVHRAMGSLAFAAAARAVWLVVKDPGDASRRLLLPAKNNLGPDGSGLSYRLEGGVAGAPPRVAWGDTPVAVDAERLDAAPPPPPTGKGDRARRWLADALAEGPVAAADTLSAGREAGFGQNLLRRTLHEIGGVAFRDAGRSVWRLAPPPPNGPPPNGAPPNGAPPNGLLPSERGELWREYPIDGVRTAADLARELEQRVGD